MSGLKGMDSLNQKLALIMNCDITRPLNKAALVVENAAKVNCPVDTGELRSSITHEVEDHRAYIGTNKEYAPYVEIGTGLWSSLGNGRKERWSYQTADGEWHSTLGQKPQPFLEPALANNKRSVIDTLRKEINEELKDIARH